MLQVRFITQDALDAERERSNRSDAMLTSDYARPMGVVNGTSVGGTRKSRNSGPSSECISYKLDADGNKVGAHIFHPRSKSPNRRKIDKADELALMDKIAEHRKLTAADLAPIFAD